MNYYYLCADLHQYQSGNIEITKLGNSDSMNIKQYIVGTGGAKLDPYDSTLITHNEEYEKLNIKYKMNKDDITNSCSEYGFLKCIENIDNNIDFKFIKADTIGIPILRRLTSKKSKRNTLSSRPKSAYIRRSTRRRRPESISYRSRNLKSI
jgi:prolyl-tRNA synthetase